jgi:hypothetical protein
LRTVLSLRRVTPDGMALVAAPFNGPCRHCGRTSAPQWIIISELCNRCYQRQRRGLPPLSPPPPEVATADPAYRTQPPPTVAYGREW